MGEEMLRNFFNVGIETDAEEGSLRFYLFKDFFFTQDCFFEIRNPKSAIRNQIASTFKISGTALFTASSTPAVIVISLMGQSSQLPRSFSLRTISSVISSTCILPPSVSR